MEIDLCRSEVLVIKKMTKAYVVLLRDWSYPSETISAVEVLLCENDELANEYVKARYPRDNKEEQEGELKCVPLVEVVTPDDVKKAKRQKMLDVVRTAKSEVDEMLSERKKNLEKLAAQTEECMGAITSLKEEGQRLLAQLDDPDF